MSDLQNPFLREIVALGGAVESEAKRLTQPLSRDQLTWRPQENAWSVAECLQHMTITLEQYLARMKPALARTGARTAGDVPPWKPTIGARFLIWGLKSTRKLPAPAVFRPVHGVSDSVVEEFLRLHSELGGLVRASDGINLNRLSFGSPVTPLIRVNVADSFMILMLHARRHLRQVERVTLAPGFLRKGLD